MTIKDFAKEVERHFKTNTKGWDPRIQEHAIAALRRSIGEAAIPDFHVRQALSEYVHDAMSQNMKDRS